MINAVTPELDRLKKKCLRALNFSYIFKCLHYRSDKTHLQLENDGSEGICSLNVYLKYASCVLVLSCDAEDLPIICPILAS